jgi:hypothetical protein
MNHQSKNSNDSHHEEYQPPIIYHQQRIANEERLRHENDATAEDDHVLWLMATPKVSWDESDGRILPTPSCDKKINLSPPPLLSSKNSSNNNSNQRRHWNNNRSDSVLSLPSLDRLDDLQQPVFRLKQRKYVVGDDSATARWRLRHRTSSDPLDYLIQPAHPQPRRPQRLQQHTTSSSSSASSSAQEPQLPQQRKRAVSYDQHAQLPLQHRRQQQQRLCEEGMEEEEDELIELLSWK